MDTQITFFEGIDASQLTERQLTARIEHQSVIANSQAARANIIACCYSLKRIRDEKLYTEFGFETFEDYTQTAHNIKLRQAYNLIAIVENNSREFLQSNANLGLTKLIALSSLDEAEKEKFIAEHDVENMTTRELNEEIKKLQQQLKSKEEQISILNSDLEKEKSKAVTNNDDLIMKKAYEIAEERTKEIVEKEIEKALKEAEEKNEKLSAENDNLASEIERYRQEAEKYLAFKEQAERTAAEAEELKKHMAVSSNPELTKFKFMFENWQKVSNELIEQLHKLDGIAFERCALAIKTVSGRWQLEKKSDEVAAQ